MSADVPIPSTLDAGGGVRVDATAGSARDRPRTMRLPRLPTGQLYQKALRDTCRAGRGSRIV